MSPQSIICGDAVSVLRTIKEDSVQCIVTSPPYWNLRDYHVDGQIGMEPTVSEYVSRLADVFAEARRVLHPTGTLWLNLGDSYNTVPSQNRMDKTHLSGSSPRYTPPVRQCLDTSLKPKDLVGVPWRVAFALQAAGWWLRSDIVWHKPSPMPESVKDRPTRAHEYVFLLTKCERYYFDAQAIREPPRGHSRRHAGFNERWDRMTPEEQQSFGANRRDVWTIATCGFSGPHYATFPEDLVKPCVLAGTKMGDTVMDPFCGAGTTGVVAVRYGRTFVGADINPEYCRMAQRRVRDAHAQQVLTVEDGDE